MLFFLRSLVYCELGLLFVLHATELQAQALKAVGKSYHESSSPSRLTSSLRDAGRPAVEEAEVVLMSVDEEDEYPDKGPLSPISHQSSLNTERTLSRYKKLRTGNCNKCMKMLSKNTSFCILKHSYGIETVVKNRVEPGFQVLVVHVDHRDFHLGQTSSELAQLFYPSSKTKFNPRFGKCRCSPSEMKRNGGKAALQVQINYNNGISKSTEQIVRRLVKRLLKLSCEREDNSKLYTEKVRYDTGISVGALRIASDEDKQPLVLKVVSRRGRNFKVEKNKEDRDETPIPKLRYQPHLLVNSSKVSLHKTGVAVSKTYGRVQ